MHICESRTRPDTPTERQGAGAEGVGTPASVMAAETRDEAASVVASGVAIVDRSAWFDSAKCAANLQQQQH